MKVAAFSQYEIKLQKEGDPDPVFHADCYFHVKVRLVFRGLNPTPIYMSIRAVKSSDFLACYIRYIHVGKR